MKRLATLVYLHQFFDRKGNIEHRKRIEVLIALHLERLVNTYDSVQYGYLDD